jgi:hypothetical protein
MHRPITRGAVALAAAGALALGGSALATAASTTTSTTTTTTPSGARPPAHFPAPGTAAHEGAETAVPGADAARAQAAAVKAVGGGTAGAVTSDYFGHGYEVTVTKTNGTKVEVHLNPRFQAMPGPGGGPCPGGPMGPPSGSGSSLQGAPPAPAGA